MTLKHSQRGLVHSRGGAGVGGSLLLSLGPDATRFCLCPPSVTGGDEV